MSATVETSFFFMLVLFLVQLLVASRGDREPLFQACVEECLANDIPSIFLWTPKETCDYDCMWQLVHIKQKKDEPIEQYYGKWPFYRIWIIQEPMSTLFSFLNLSIQLRYLNAFNPKWEYSRDMNLFVILQILTWLASMSLHTISNDLTERLDYFSAGFVVVYGMYIVCIFLFKMSRLVFIPFSLLFAYYVNFQLERSGLDYGLHMLIFSVIGAVHNLIWFINGLVVNKPHALKSGFGAIFTLVCLGLLEWMDFAFVGYLDAHALWHLSTVFVAKYFYDYWLFEQNQALRFKQK